MGKKFIIYSNKHIIKIVLYKYNKNISIYLSNFQYIFIEYTYIYIYIHTFIYTYHLSNIVFYYSYYYHSPAMEPNARSIIKNGHSSVWNTPLEKNRDSFCFDQKKSHRMSRALVCLVGPNFKKQSFLVQARGKTFVVPRAIGYQESLPKSEVFFRHSNLSMVFGWTGTLGPKSLFPYP